jgi:hypothetical protein
MHLHWIEIHLEYKKMEEQASRLWNSRPTAIALKYQIFIAPPPDRTFASCATRSRGRIAASSRWEKLAKKRNRRDGAGTLPRPRLACELERVSQCEFHHAWLAQSACIQSDSRGVREGAVVCQRGRIESY